MLLERLQMSKEGHLWVRDEPQLAERGQVLTASRKENLVLIWDVFVPFSSQSRRVRVLRGRMTFPRRILSAWSEPKLGLGRDGPLPPITPSVRIYGAPTRGWA